MKGNKKAYHNVILENKKIGINEDVHKWLSMFQLY